MQIYRLTFRRFIVFWSVMCTFSVFRAKISFFLWAQPFCSTMIMERSFVFNESVNATEAKRSGVSSQSRASLHIHRGFQTMRYLGKYWFFQYGFWHKNIRNPSWTDPAWPDPALTLTERLFLSQFKRYNFLRLTNLSYRF